MAIHDRLTRDPTAWAWNPMLKDGSSTAMNVNGSITPVDFKATAPYRVMLTSMHFELRDVGTDPGLFGGIAALTNGIQVSIHDESDTLLMDLTVDETIKTNGDWGSLGGTTSTESVIDAAGAKPDMWNITIGLVELDIILDPNWYVRVRVADNLTLVDHFHGGVHGHLA